MTSAVHKRLATLETNATSQVYQNTTSGDEGEAQSAPMTAHGQIGEFHRDTADCPSYVKRLKCYFTANDVEESGKQRVILLSCCGVAMYGLIRSLAAPHKHNDVSYQELVKRVTTHFNPKPSKIVARFKFNLHS